MHFHPSERVGVFIDGYHIYSVAKALGAEVDYKELHRFFATRCHLIRAHYFGISVDDAEYVATRPLTDWLQYNGFTVQLRTVRHPGDTSAIIRERARLDVDMAVQVICAADTLDHVVIISGEESFISLAAALKRRGKVVTVISTLRSEAASVSDQLRRTADQFVELADLTSVINVRQPTGGGGSDFSVSSRTRRPRGPSSNHNSAPDAF